MFSKMVDLALTPEESRADYGPMPAGAYGPDAKDMPRYPFGLALSLTERELEKLGYGVDELPEVGDMTHIMAMGSVTSVSCNETEGGKKCRVEIQLRYIAVEGEDEEEAEAA